MTQRPNRLPQKYYVRRRVAALVVILVVVALIIWGLVAWGGSSSEEADQASAETTSQAPEPTPTETTSEEETSEEETPVEESESEESETESEESTEAAGGDTCDIDDLQITASTDKPSYDEDEQPTMYMKVENPTDVDCKIELEDDTLRFEVYGLHSNNRWWADTDCYPSVITGEEVFPAGSERNFQAVWSRAASAPGKCTDREQVPAGSYFLHGVIGENASDAATFNLST